MRNILRSFALVAGLAGTASANGGGMTLDRPASAPTAWGGAPGVFYLNRNGALVYPAQMSNSSTNQSPLVPQPVAIPPFQWGDAAWSQLMSCVRAQFAPFDVMVTDVDPGSAEHIEAIIGGSPSLIGQPPGVGGFAAGYCGIIDTRGVEFVFPDAMPYGNVQLLCEVAAQEVAHAFGLDHEMLCSDPMSYCPSNAPKTFQNLDAPCGESYARPCRCGGYAQNSFRMLMEAMGPADGMDDDPEPQPPGYPQPPPPPPYQPMPTCNAASPSGFAPLVLAALALLYRRRRRA